MDKIPSYVSHNINFALDSCEIAVSGKLCLNLSIISMPSALSRCSKKERIGTTFSTDISALPFFISGLWPNQSLSSKKVHDHTLIRLYNNLRIIMYLFWNKKIVRIKFNATNETLDSSGFIRVNVNIRCAISPFFLQNLLLSCLIEVTIWSNHRVNKTKYLSFMRRKNVSY